MSSPRFAPWLMPLATRSIGPGSRPRKTRPTASDGEPSIDQAGEPSASVRSRTRSGRHIVREWPTALWFVSGAMTSTSPSGSSACLRARSPRDSIPSSLVTRIRGRAVIPPPAGRSRCRRVGRRRRRAQPPPPAGATGRLGVDLVFDLLRLAGPRLAQHPLGPPVALGEAAGRPGRHRALVRVGGPAEEVEEERRDDGRHGQAEEGARDAEQLHPDQDRGEDDHRVEAHGARQDARLEDVLVDEPAHAHDRERGQEDVGLRHRRHDHRRRPGDEGPEERDRHQDAGGRGGQGGVLEPQDQVAERGRRGRTVPPITTMPRMKPAERAAHALREQVRLVAVGRRDEAQEERADGRAVDRDEDRQEEDDQEVADEPDARDGHVLQGPEEVLRLGGEGGQDRADLGRDVHLVEAERAEPVGDGLDEGHEVLPGTGPGCSRNSRGRGEEGGGRHDHEAERDDRDRAVGDRHGEDPWHEAGEPGRDRLQDEPQEPGEEEDEDQVGEERPRRPPAGRATTKKRAIEPRAEHDLQPAVLARGEGGRGRLRRGGARRQGNRRPGPRRGRRGQLQFGPRLEVVHRFRSRGPGGPGLRRSYRRPIFSWTSASVASTIGFRRAAPSSRTASTRSGCASSSA